MNHSKEPWRSEDGDGVIYSADGEDDFVLEPPNRSISYKNFSDEDLSRVIACVNACKGISNDDLKGGVESVDLYIRGE